MTRIETVEALRPAYDLIVIGAGPAGMSAATEAARHGLSVLLADENPGPGGQIYRAITETPVQNRAILGDAYWAGAPVAEAMAAAAIDYAPGATIWHLDKHLELGLSIGGRARTVSAQRVIIATGAQERPFPIKGWTLPGVTTIGAAQTLLKSGGVVARGRVVLAGCGPLLWLLAAQYVEAGAPPSLILDTTPSENWAKALPSALSFMASPYFAKGLGLMLKVRRKVKVVSGVTALAIEGEEHATAITWKKGDGAEQRFAADHILLHQGVVPHVNLANAAGVPLAWNEDQACFQPEADAWGQTPVEGIALAGDGMGIGGAEAAATRGHLAGIAAAAALGRLTPARRDELAAPFRARLAKELRGRVFLDRLYKPAPHFRRAADEAMACRCEEVSGKTLREVVSLGVPGPNQLKAFLRCGMGPCQGRLCGLTVTETIAEARGCSQAEVGYYRLRTPVKPLTLGEMATMPASESDVKAVVR
ncbi:FAD-dependent oxidoreductase [Acetobacteraceae bacterium H6797]|nr:FAD-dependent oxidoreductase [Acetobacteraceae bacterium H6797]